MIYNVGDQVQYHGSLWIVTDVFKWGVRIRLNGLVSHMRHRQVEVEPCDFEREESGQPVVLSTYEQKIINQAHDDFSACEAAHAEIMADNSLNVSDILRKYGVNKNLYCAWKKLNGYKGRGVRRCDASDRYEIAIRMIREGMTITEAVKKAHVCGRRLKNYCEQMHGVSLGSLKLGNRNVSA